MKHLYIIILTFLSLCFINNKAYGQLHLTPSCGQNFNLKWSTSLTSEDYYWPPGSMSNTYTNVDGSGVDMTITFTGETNTLGFWAGQTPKVGTQSSYLYKGIDLLSNGFSGDGITCTITFSKPIYAFSFDVHHVNKWEENGDKYTFTGKDVNGNTIYPEFTNSNLPTYTSDNTTGIVNANSNLMSGDNAIIGVNFSDPNHIKSISFLWEDCDTCSHFLPHATGIGDFSFCTPQTLDFDGIDDYISLNPFLGGNKEVTMMSWIKLDKGFDGGEIMGQRNFRLYIDDNKELSAFIKTDLNRDIISSDTSNIVLEEDTWYHVALCFNGNTGITRLFLNGNSVWELEDSDLIGRTLINTPAWALNFDFEIGRNAENINNYFEGSINECRVYNKALNTYQLQQQVNQKIENNNGKIRGTLIPKDLDDLLWNDLILYYQMEAIDTGYTSDGSNSKMDGKLNNMTTEQEYTAPLPFVINNSNDGRWVNLNNIISNTETQVPSIIQIKGNVEVNTNLNTNALILDKGSILKVKENSALYNSWYLKLDGTLDLENDAQLIQTENSTLDKTSSGILEKDLQGTADTYSYNYWSSPVGKQNDSTLNNKYTVKDVFTNINFLTSGYDGTPNPLSIADYWIWKYNNKLGDTYSSWQHVRSTGEILPGEGFTMKGPGTGTITEEQNYTLQGKPNNGDISLNVFAGNDYMVGNPYPSAIDAVKFIQDNQSIISGMGSLSGTLYFWKHWGGGSHIATDYQGGYATLSLSGGVPAASKTSEIYIVSTGGSPSEIPGRYIPIGQGFYATAETNGKIIFNNSQRVFYTENDTSLSGKALAPKNTSLTANDTRMKLRIGFNSVNELKRQLLITVDENATSGYDWGYDSKYIDSQIDDMYWMINNEKYTIQGIDEINEETIIPLGIHTKKDGFNSISIDNLEYTPENLQIYLHVKELEIYHDLKQNKYETYLSTGEYLTRFEIAFSKPQLLGIEENKAKQIDVYFSNEKNSIVINNPNSRTIESVEMLNILGQSLFNIETNTNDNHLEYKANLIKPGNYVLKIKTMYGKFSKKVIID